MSYQSHGCLIDESRSRRYFLSSFPREQIPNRTQVKPILEEREQTYSYVSVLVRTHVDIDHFSQFDLGLPANLASFINITEDRVQCVKLLHELPDAAMPEAKEALSDLRDHYHFLGETGAWALAGPGAGMFRFSESLEQQFDHLKNEWIQETAIMSFAEDMMGCDSFHKIVALGEPVVPLILRELEQRRYHWDLFLVEITGENPVPKNAHGNLKKTAAAWIAWGQKRYVR